MPSPATEPLLTVPYVGLAEFKASPTWLDLADLIEGGTQAQQDAELTNQLLKASAWADNFCMQPLRAHTATEQVRTRVDKYGRVFLHPMNTPVRSVIGMAYGPDPKTMSVLTDLTMVWVEDQRGIVVSTLPYNGAFNTLQFGGAQGAGGEVYVQYQYVAGFANTYLTQPVAQNSANLTVADPSGFVPPQTSLFSTSYGGSIARIWDPALEEAVSIASNYVPGNNPLLLSSGVANAHVAGVQVSEFPPEIRQAVIQYACGLLLREDTAEDAPFGGSPGPVSRRSGGRGVAGGLIDEAERFLMPYRRVR